MLMGTPVLNQLGAELHPRYSCMAYEVGFDVAQPQGQWAVVPLHVVAQPGYEGLYAHPAVAVSDGVGPAAAGPGA
jgi:hypothetical protein